MSKKSVSSPTTRRKFLGGAALARRPWPRPASSRRRAHQHALAEHLAVEGHFPRIRARLRQEGQRHDRRRPQDRGAARGCGGARIRLARRGVEGTLDGGHGVLVYHYGKQNALALWGSGPGYGMDANMLLAWHKYGGGKELLAKLYASIGANVVSFPYGPMRPSRSAGSRSRSPRSKTSRASNSAPSASRLTCSRAWAPR